MHAHKRLRARLTDPLPRARDDRHRTVETHRSILSPNRGEPNREATESAHVAGVHSFEPRLLHDEIRKHRKDLFESDSGFQTREGGTETVVYAEAEGQMIGGVTRHVERVGITPVAGVAIRSRENQRDLSSLLHGAAVKRDVARERSRHHVRRGIEA